MSLYKHPALPCEFRPLLPALRSSYEASAQSNQKIETAYRWQVQPFVGWLVRLLWHLLTSPCSSGNVSVTVVLGAHHSGRQTWRPPRVLRATFTLMPAAYTAMPSVQISDFEDISLLIRHDRLVCDFCSSGQRFACSFLQIPPHDGHPCRPANSSLCRACRGLSPPSDRLHTTCNQMAFTRHAPCRAH